MEKETVWKYEKRTIFLDKLNRQLDQKTEKHVESS